MLLITFFEILGCPYCKSVNLLFFGASKLKSFSDICSINRCWLCGVEFEDVHRLSDGQVKHSPGFFYAGSLWKVSIQVLNDEDPQGRRTLGLFLHRLK
ncbi:hypothetical protein HRI_001680000 [Hibiscus trionum]|uniref:Uncharacterized protein n=1 Tax=Hibiscus trionum TaxID=183268 RepID=A0A9W7HMI2_HIBTR|nr:hypothetical protein HRI_001680000 [Hibiscus trionum]